MFSELEYRDTATRVTLVLELDKPPPREIAEKVARDCGVSPENVTFIFAPTQSLAGGVQVVSRVLEVALHKTHELKFPLARVVDGLARRRCRRRIRILSRPWDAPMMRSSMAVRPISS